MRAAEQQRGACRRFAEPQGNFDDLFGRLVRVHPAQQRAVLEQARVALDGYRERLAHVASAWPEHVRVPTRGGEVPGTVLAGTRRL